MALLLTTPKSTGDLDPNAVSYEHVKVVVTTHNSYSHSITLQCQYGNEDGYDWNAGIVPCEFHIIEGDDYYAILTEMPDEGETSYQAVSRALYEWLIDNEIYSGTYI
jgi:hypothetical protein